MRRLLSSIVSQQLNENLLNLQKQESPEVHCLKKEVMAEADNVSIKFSLLNHVQRKCSTEIRKGHIMRRSSMNIGLLLEDERLNAFSGCGRTIERDCRRSCLQMLHAPSAPISEAADLVSDPLGAADDQHVTVRHPQSGPWGLRRPHGRHRRLELKKSRYTLPRTGGKDEELHKAMRIRRLIGTSPCGRDIH